VCCVPLNMAGENFLHGAWCYPLTFSSSFFNPLTFLSVTPPISHFSARKGIFHIVVGAAAPDHYMGGHLVRGFGLRGKHHNSMNIYSIFIKIWQNIANTVLYIVLKFQIDRFRQTLNMFKNGSFLVVILSSPPSPPSDCTFESCAEPIWLKFGMEVRLGQG